MNFVNLQIKLLFQQNGSHTSLEHIIKSEEKWLSVGKRLDHVRYRWIRSHSILVATRPWRDMGTPTFYSGIPYDDLRIHQIAWVHTRVLTQGRKLKSKCDSYLLVNQGKTWGSDRGNSRTERGQTKWSNVNKQTRLRENKASARGIWPAIGFGSGTLREYHGICM